MSNLPDPVITITWKNTLNGALLNQSFEQVKDMATHCGYPYFCYDDKVYKTFTGREMANVTADQLDYY